MPETSMPTNIKFTGIQTLTSFQLSFSSETNPDTPKTITMIELMRFCKNYMF